MSDHSPSPDTPPQPEMPQPDVPALDPTAEALVEVVNRSYVATSTDGTVSAEAGGDQQLRSVSIDAYAPTLPALTQALNEAIRDSIKRAQDDTVRAMAEVPGLDPTLAGLLRNGQP